MPLLVLLLTKMTLRFFAFSLFSYYVHNSCNYFSIATTEWKHKYQHKLNRKLNHKKWNSALLERNFQDLFFTSAVLVFLILYLLLLLLIHFWISFCDFYFLFFLHSKIFTHIFFFSFFSFGSKKFSSLLYWKPKSREIAKLLSMNVLKLEFSCQIFT